MIGIEQHVPAQAHLGQFGLRIQAQMLGHFQEVGEYRGANQCGHCVYFLVRRTQTGAMKL